MGELSVNKECWTCQYQNIPKNSFLGECTYFINKGQKSKDIPPHIVDKGCKYYIKKEGESNKSKSNMGALLNIFEGKIIP